ncbi:hypothetical protein C9374_014261, partial [Naegleria lovaniensis]
MPQHNPPHYFKDNSLEGFISTFGDYVDKNNRIVYNMWDYYDYYYEDENATVRSIPIALILELQEDLYVMDQLPKYILCSDFTKIPKKKYRPSYLFIAIRTKGYWMEFSFALLKLGKLGSWVDESRLTFLYHSNDHSSRSYSITDQLDSIYISYCDEKQMKFLVGLELQFGLVLNEQDVKKSTFHYSETNDHLLLRYHRIWGDTVFCRNNERTYYHIVLQYHWIHTHGASRTTDLIRVSTRSETNATSNVEQLICLKDEAVQYAVLMEKGDSMEMRHDQQDDAQCKEFYIILSCQKSNNKNTNAIYKVYVPKNESPSKIPVYFTNFEKYFVDEQHHYNLEIVSYCKLTCNKYLVMAFCKSRRHSIDKITSFEQLFTDRTMWLLIDVHTHHIKQVFPRVYDLAAQQRKNKDEFTTVTKRKRGGRFAISRRSECEDGDLNGGYSNVTLLKQIKNLKGVNDKDYEHQDTLDPESENNNMFDQHKISSNIPSLNRVSLKA